MKIVRRKNRGAEVYTSSLNDIMFFLLLFFLIISTMVTPATIKVVLPKATAAKNETLKKTVQMAISRDLHYYINNEEVSFDMIKPQLERLLLESKARGEEVSVVLQADKNLSLQQVVDVINVGYELGVKMVLFAQKGDK